MKNIILCADGTGNLGGTTPDSNVYRTYHLVDRADSTTPQLTYYDNGVGTASNTYWRAFTGAFGFGFKQNIRELYTFLAKHYEPGDHVFLFGFSRGAAEVRALTGLIAAAGLINGASVPRKPLQEKVEEAFDIYEKGQRNSSFGEYGAIPIHFIGVWDTVSALGFPQDWNVKGYLTFLLNGLFYGLDRLFDWIFPHRFYNYSLTPNIRHAYQALAIDETRLSFTPKVWDERGESPSNDKRPVVEQVWFAGAHSNVGGGYGRAGLSYVALAWMLSKAQACGLQLRKDGLSEAMIKANPYGRLYDPRAGIGVFYRYFPRDLEILSANKDGKSTLRGKIKIHESVFDRMHLQTANYAPGHLPATFEIVKTEFGTSTVSSEVQDIAIPEPTEWKVAQEEVNKWAGKRAWLYIVFLEVVLVVVMAGWKYWVFPPEGMGQLSNPSLAWTFPWAMHHLADFFRYILPAYFDGLIYVAVEQYPAIFGIFVLVVLGLFRQRYVLRDSYLTSCETVRSMILKATSGQARGRGEESE